MHFVHRVLRTAHHHGIDTAPALRRAGIPGDLAHRPTARVTVHQAATLTRAIWEVTDDELFGLGPPVPRGSAQLVALSIIHARDLRSVLCRASEATRVLGGAPRLSVSEADDAIRVEIDVSRLDDPEHLAVDLMAAFVHRFGGWLIGKRIALAAIEFPYAAPPYAADYDALYGRMPTFDAPSLALMLDRSLSTSPVVRDEDDLRRFLADSPATWYLTRDYGSATADRVRAILEQGLRGRWPPPEEVASRLTVSVQHLRRLLRAEDTSMTQIREDILRDAAIASLARGEEPVDALAARLGFSDGRAFRRAFHRWTGSPPSAYRAGAEQPPS